MKKMVLLSLLITAIVLSCDDGKGDGTSPHTHDYGTAWKSNATQHWRECSCGDKTDVADHEWEWQETTPPTATQEREATGTCGTCGATATKAVDKLPACDCDPKEHYLPCDCGATDCTCVQIPRGYVTNDVGVGTSFPIYQSVGVTDEQAVTATQTIKDAHDGLGAIYKGQLAGANVEIWIVPPGGYSVPQKDESGKIIGRLLYTASQAGIRSWFQNNVIPLLTP